MSPCSCSAGEDTGASYWARAWSRVPQNPNGPSNLYQRRNGVRALLLGGSNFILPASRERLLPMYLRGETSSPPPHNRLINQLLKLERLFLQCDLHLICSQFLWEHIRPLPFFQTRCLLFTLFLSPQNCITGWGRSHVFWIFSPHFLRQHQGSLLLSSSVLSFRISAFSSQDESECSGIPKECVVGRTTQTVLPFSEIWPRPGA